MSVEFEDRKRLAERAKIPHKAYWLTKPCYMQQIGDAAPVLVQAAPSMPVMVLLPDGEMVTRKRKDGSSWTHPEIQEGPHLKAVGDVHEPPKKPIDAHLPGKKPEPVKKAHEKHGPVEKTGV